MAKSNHNKYVSYPDWFGSSTSQPAQQQQVTQTIYYGGGGSSGSSGGTGLTGVITQGPGNAVTSGTLDGNTLVLNKDLTFATDQSNTNSFWELREDLNGKSYLYANYDIATLGGHTMYVDGDDTLSLPGLYDGVPIDNITIYWDTDENGNKVLKSAGTGSGGGGVADKIAWANVYGKPSWVTDYKPIYDYSEIQNVPDLSGFVTIEKYQEIKGVKNFLNGIQIADLPITKLNGYEDVIYIDANVVVRGGVTMYYQYGEVDLPSIVDEIGIAGYDGKKLGLVSFSSSQFLIDANGNVTIKGGSTGLDTAQLKNYLDSNKYTTETWVKEQGYASASSLSSLQNKVNNFLEGSDTDTIINKWMELEAFLSGLSESDNLATILSTKWTTDNNLINQWNTAYGWGDHSTVGYALKSYVDKTFVTIAGNEDVTGVHDFVNGLKIGNIKLSKSQEGVVYLEGNLVVKGGVTMYALDEVTVDSIIESLPLASTSQYGIAKFNPSNFVINEDGFVTIIGGSGATVKYPLSWSGFNQGSYDGSVAQSFYIPTKLSEFVNDRSFATTSDLSGYLPLSGGTIVGDLIISNNYGGIAINDTSAKKSGFILYSGGVWKVSNDGWTIDYDLWHSGNDGAGSGLDADLLDGLDSSAFARNKYNNNFIVSGNEFNFVPSAFTNHIWINYRTQSGLDGSITNYNFGNGAGSTENVTLNATTFTGNSASATKLQTARTIWGQPFDGIEDVSGNISLGNNSIIGASNRNAFNPSGTDLYIGSGYTAQGDRTFIYGNVIRMYAGTGTEALRINNNGNILIGTPTDSGYKLDVNGKVNITSQGEGAELLKFNTEKPWVFRQKYTGGSSALELHSSGAQKFFYITSDENDIIAEYYCSASNLSYLRYKGDVFPLGGSLFNLGREASRWKASYVDNSIVTYDVTLGRTLNVNGINISKLQDNVLYIDGNLVVRGGVTMYAENEVDIPSIIDSLPIASTTSLGVAKFDSNFFSVGSDGKVTFIGSVGTTVENATYTTKGIASFNSASFTINDGAVDLKTKIVITSSTPSSFNNNTLYIIT